MSEKGKNRGNRRKMNYTKAIRKKNISESKLRDGFYEHLGQYIKGKIHCSCLGCTSYSKTNTKGRWCGGKKNYKTSDRRKVESMDNQIMEEII